MTAPEVPHADLIAARVRFTTTPCRTCDGWEQHVYVTRYMTDDGLVTSEVRGLTNANHQRGCALGDTVPREEHDRRIKRVEDAAREGWSTALLAERDIDRLTGERDEARAERDALARVIEQAPHAPGCQIHGLWILPVRGPVAVQQSGECTCWKSTAPAASLALHDAEVKAQAWDAAAEAGTMPSARGPIRAWLHAIAAASRAEATAGRDQQ